MTLEQVEDRAFSVRHAYLRMLAKDWKIGDHWMAMSIKLSWITTLLASAQADPSVIAVFQSRAEYCEDQAKRYWDVKVLPH